MSNGPQFFETKMGRQFYDGTMPRIATALDTIAGALEQRQADEDEIADVLLDVIDVLWDWDKSDWKELQSCADAVQDITLALTKVFGKSAFSRFARRKK
jgi:hypothetical protein